MKLRILSINAAITLTSLWLAVSAVASETTTQHVQRVYVNVTSSDSIIESGLLKRLREFKDVQIQAKIEDAEDDFYINALPITVHDRLLGYAISVVYAVGFPSYSNIIPPEATVGSHLTSLQWIRDFLDKDRKGRTVYVTNFMYISTRETLSHTLDHIVAELNVQVFEPLRKAFATHHDE
jgi:hypothetical protein